ncbi:MAG: hypothetical protein QOH79_2584 [Acidimicrobiaceae bacterium]
MLQWLESLRRCGHEVLYHDVIGPTLAVPDDVKPWLERGPVALLSPNGDARFGLDASHVERFAATADAVVSLGATYSIDLEPWLAEIRPRILVDQDPGFTHVWSSGRDPLTVFGDHDVYFTVGANIGTARSDSPTCGIAWEHTWNPVCLDWWDPAAPVLRDRFTTVASLWGQDYQIFRGRTWGPKAEQLRAFHRLPALAGEGLEIAVEDASDAATAELAAQGWTVVPASQVAGSVSTYREYVNGSLAEFAAVKGLYVGTHSGWFSDRSACYLAAGRPVVLETTGFEDVLPTGWGLIAVTTLDDAVEAVKDVRGDHRRHARAARALAEEVFDGNIVVKRLLATAGVD